MRLAPDNEDDGDKEIAEALARLSSAKGVKREIDLAVLASDRTTFVRKPQLAEVYGGLSIFKPAEKFARWQVTHVNTGMRVIDGIMKRETAVEVVGALNKISWDWGKFGALGNREQYDMTREAVGEARQIIQTREGVRR